MKRFNKNILLFALVALLTLGGICSEELKYDLTDSLRTLRGDILSGNADAFRNFTVKVDGTSKLLRNQEALLDLNSAKENLLGTRVVEKEETTVVKSSSGSLLGYIQTQPYPEETIRANAGEVVRLQKLAQDHGAKFLYCAVAEKNAYQELPANVTEYNTHNSRRFLQELIRNDVPVLDTAEFFRELAMTGEEIFFRTDHHWTPAAGFYMSGAICRELQQRYGFRYDPALADLSSYSVETLENRFLGSYGKKVGTYFAGSRVDDFDVITPKFPTDFVEEIPSFDRVRTGGFEDTMLYTELLEEDYYQNNTYAAYSGGDFRLQKITNRSNPDGPKILVIRQSFGCVVTPFLAVHAGELYAVDDRGGDYPAGEILNIAEFLDAEKPDYVVVIK